MNLSIFFEPLQEDAVEMLPTRALGSLISRFVSKFPNWRETDIALIGVPDFRGSAQGVRTTDGPDKIREALYLLLHGIREPRMADLGNLRPGISVEDTYERLKEICALLIEHGTLPLIIGGSHDLDYGQYLAYEHQERGMNMVCIDSRFDMHDTDEFGLNQHRLHKLLMHEPNHLFSLAVIGYQRYFTDPEVLNIAEKLHFETVRVGEVHQNLTAMEPIIRNADMVSFDVSAIKMQDAPASPNAAPFGLTGEQACQLCWYAGASNQLSSFGLYEYDPTLDQRGQTAQVIATMLWYLIEGYYHRQPEDIFDRARVHKYSVAFGKHADKLHFYKSRHSEKWWMEVPAFTDGKPPRIVACSYDDYLMANEGELPHRWLLTQARIG